MEGSLSRTGWGDNDRDRVSAGDYYDRENWRTQVYTYIFTTVYIYAHTTHTHTSMTTMAGKTGVRRYVCMYIYTTNTCIYMYTFTLLYMIHK